VYDSKTLQHVATAHHLQIIDRLPLDMPLELAGSTIVDEGYWRRRSQMRWAICNSAQHGGSYKQLYFERHLQDTIEECARTPSA
jgi:hypothetical protein